MKSFNEAKLNTRNLFKQNGLILATEQCSFAEELLQLDTGFMRNVERFMIPFILALEVIGQNFVGCNYTVLLWSREMGSPLFCNVADNISHNDEGDITSSLEISFIILFILIAP